MAQFDYFLNRQGVRGPQGEQGEQGFSPIITVETDTLSEYILQIQTQNNTFLTANLREHKDDLGGTYIRYNRETGAMYAGDADTASQSQVGVVRFATATDIEREANDCVVSPADVADMIEAVDPSGDITNLQNRVTTLEGETANYVLKSTTINGYALNSNIALIANDVNAYNKSEISTLLSAKANVSDLPNMNNYYNTTQIDLMLNEKADISDIPTVPTNISAFANDVGYITSSALPTVGNGTITFTQGGVTKGTITTNQSGDTTIALDAGGSQYILPPATTSTLGGVIVDGTTITVDSNGVITAVGGGGGGGTTYNSGNGIDINSSTNTISAKPDGSTIDFNTNGELEVISTPIPSNMVTTDTNQSIGGTKTFNTTQIFSGGLRTHYIYNETGTARIITLSVNTTDIATDSLTTTRNANTYNVIDSGNIGSYALTSSNISTNAYIQALEARIAALEANINGGSAASA